MTRNLKVLGLALVAVFAMGAMTASAASAQQGFLTSESSPVVLEGTDEAEGNKFEAFGIPVECSHATYEGTELAPENGTRFTVTPNYENPCVAAKFLPATVDMTGCDYVLELGDTTGDHEYAVDANLDCSAGPGSYVDLTIWLSHESHTKGAGEAFCHVRVTPGGPFPGATATDETNGHVTLGGTAKNLVVHRYGPCAAEQGETAPEPTLDLAVTTTGQGGAALSISEEKE